VLLCTEIAVQKDFGKQKNKLAIVRHILRPPRKLRWNSTTGDIVYKQY